MNAILFFLLTFGSCAKPDVTLVSNAKYQGYEQTIPRGFIANYVTNSEGTSKWLSSPVVFKLTADRDTMFMYTSGKGYMFQRIKDSMKCYSGHVGQNKIKFTILEASIEAEMPDCRKLRISNRSMI